MKYSSLLILGGSLVILLSACEEKPQVVEKPTPATTNFETARLGAAVDSYITSPTEAQAAAVDKAFAEIDGEIAELDQQVTAKTGDEKAEAETKARNLRAYRDKESLRFTEAKARAKAEAAAEKVQSTSESVVEKTGEAVRDAAESVKDGVDKAVDTVRDAIP